MKVQVTGGHPSKRTYQAIRIELNHELDVLRDTLDTMIDLLNDGGRICIITFHSLEDRIVKSNFKKNENPCTCPSNFPVCVCGKKSKGRVVTRKPVLPSEKELGREQQIKECKFTRAKTAGGAVRNLGRTRKYGRMIALQSGGATNFPCLK